MLDEAADQFEKVEVRAPALPVVHAYLGAVFERRGETRAAFDEYRRALQLGHAFDWPHQCATCGATSALWQRSEEHTSELQSRLHLVCRLLLEKKKKISCRPAPARGFAILTLLD